MTAPDAAVAQRAWQASIDPRLVARLMRVQRPGLIGAGLARRILGAVDALAGRLPLLARFPRAKAGERAASSVPIVHVAPAGTRSTRGEAEAASIAGLQGRAGAALPVAPGRMVDRAIDRMADRTGDRMGDRMTDRRGELAPIELRPVVSGAERRAPEPRPLTTEIQRVDAGTSPAMVAARVHTLPEPVSAERDLRTPAGVEAAAIAPVSPARQPGRPVESEPPPPIVHANAALAAASDLRRPAAGQAGTAAGDALPPVVPERAGELRHEPGLVERAPVVAAAASAAPPQTVHALATGPADGARGAATSAAERTGGSIDPASLAPAPRATAEAAVARSDARGRRSRMGAPLVLPHGSPVAPRSAPGKDTAAERPGSARPALEPPRPAPRHAIVRPRSVAPAALSPGLTEIDEVAGPRVAPRRARSSDTPRVPAVAPRHLAAPAAGHAAPIVVPPQARPDGRVTAAPPLAHVAPPASAPPAVAGEPAAPAVSGVPATVSPPVRSISAGGGAPAAQPPLDLRQIAAGIQQIFARQAEHERARRGIRR